MQKKIFKKSLKPTPNRFHLFNKRKKNFVYYFAPVRRSPGVPDSCQLEPLTEADK